MKTDEQKRAILAVFDGGASTADTKAALAALDELTDRHDADLAAALNCFAAVTKDSAPNDAPRLPGFLAGYLCATQEVPVVVRPGYCGVDPESFRVGHREGASMLAIYKAGKS